ncbi:hypothetical protein Dsin_013251 [Dipteronia sinensis]|uniref:RNase H type-1 domain-containing protein n=1 Tax=Dipteronia sinensis TaxID=43782 RepID=A0AAE0AJK3_9ROSI|nr:hypothetical protein Dsin_013251 [Dipteronia sinensis]
MTNTDDTLFWHFDKGGGYSVRSGYKVGVHPSCSLELPQSCSVRSSVSFITNLKWSDKASALDFLYFNSKILGKYELEYLCVILWRCWWRRNQLVHHVEARSDEDIVEWAGNFLDEFRKAEEGKSDKSIVPKFNQNTRWGGPLDGMLKINTDAAVCSNRKIIGIGIVIRDHEGCVLGCSSLSIVANYSPQVAEATAILRGILFAVDTGLLPAVVESDAKSVVDLIIAVAPPLGNVGTVITDILRLTKHYNIRVLFTPRCANMVAHILAKVPPVAEDRFYLEEYPSHVENFVLADKAM